MTKNNWKWPVVDTSVRRGQSYTTPIPSAIENVEYALNQLGITAIYNRLTKEVEVIGGNILTDAPLDVAVTQVRSDLNAHHLRICKADAWDTLIAIAMGHTYNPVCDYLTACHKKWDGKPHLDEVFALLRLDPKAHQDSEFCKTLMEKWFITAALLPFNKGDIAAQGVLILVGPQGIGKTRFLYKLLPNPDWGADGITLDPSSRDDLMRVMRFWVVEWGEIGNTIKREKMDALKQYITQKKDVLRKPYGRSVMMVPRNTVFLGTVNELPGEGFLRDLTGNRRYWPIAITKVLDTPIDLDQVWGDVMHRAFDENKPYYLSEQELAQLEELNTQHLLQSPEESLLLDDLRWDAPLNKWRWASASDLCDDINVPRSRNRNVGRALRNIARRDSRIKCPTNHHKRLYFVPPTVPIPEDLGPADPEITGGTAP